MKLGRMRHLFAITIGCIDYLLCFTFLRDSNQKSRYSLLQYILNIIFKGQFSMKTNFNLANLS